MLRANVVADLRLSSELADTQWDAFLRSSTRGHIQQSSGWARAKASGGWEPVRRGILAKDGALRGGFQLLIRSTALGRIGYVYKGPVLVDENEEDVATVATMLEKATEECRLRALVVQPPDESRLDQALLNRRRFLPNQIIKTISATLVIDLSEGLDVVKRRMRRSTRAEVRQATERGMRVRLGDRRDIPAFFALMKATCERQNTKPAPGRSQDIEAMWDAFSPDGAVQLFIAESNEKAVAGLMCFSFGKRVVAWKRGWSGECAERNPNQLTTFQAVRWAIEREFQFFDFDAVDRGIAQAILAGGRLTEAQRKSRHFINLAFGARPVLLPASILYIPTLWGRTAYRAMAMLRHSVGASQTRAR